MRIGTKGKVTIVFAFLLALGAGVVVGLAAARHIQPPASPADHDSWLASELGLDALQRERMRTIWSDLTQPQLRAIGERRRALQRERDDAIARLLTPEQKAQFEQVQQEYSNKATELGHERERVIAAAEERTRKILTEPQRQRYVQLLKDRDRQRSERDARRRAGSAAPPAGTTAPSNAPSGGSLYEAANANAANANAANANAVNANAVNAAGAPGRSGTETQPSAPSHPGSRGSAPQDGPP